MFKSRSSSGTKLGPAGSGTKLGPAGSGTGIENK
jgi:hypothetical protein